MNEKLFDPKHKNKLDNPNRKKMLPPRETLLKLGLKEGHKVIDIGAGTGFFTFPIYEITKSKVIAVDLSDEMLTSIKDKITNEEIELVKSSEGNLNINNEVSDFTFLSLVFHEVEDKISFSKELARVTTNNGTLVILEWAKKEMKMGPKLDHRLTKEEIVSSLKEEFKFRKEVEISNAFTAFVFNKK